MGNVVVVTGAGQIGQTIARRVSVGKHLLLDPPLMLAEGAPNAMAQTATGAALNRRATNADPENDRRLRTKDADSRTTCCSGISGSAFTRAGSVR